MINREHFRSPSFLFFILAVCLLPPGLLTFHSDWPPLDWKHTHFADVGIGQSFLVCSGLFCIIAVVYFYFPKLFHRRLNKLLGQLHFWANVIVLFLLLLIPIYVNLAIDSHAPESKAERFYRAFGASMSSLLISIQLLALVQILFIGNLLWSLFKGEKMVHQAISEPSSTNTKVQ